MNRLREAREYLGFSVTEVARYLDYPSVAVRSFEAGEFELEEQEWARLSRLYQRPIGWLQGEPEDPLAIPPVLLDGPRRKASGRNPMQRLHIGDLSERDTLEVARFAQWLKHGRQIG